MLLVLPGTVTIQWPGDPIRSWLKGAHGAVHQFGQLRVKFTVGSALCIQPMSSAVAWNSVHSIRYNKRLSRTHRHGGNRAVWTFTDVGSLERERLFIATFGTLYCNGWGMRGNRAKGNGKAHRHAAVWLTSCQQR